MENAAPARPLSEPSRTPSPAGPRAKGERQADPPPLAATPSDAALCRAATPEPDEAVHIDLVWRDPVTGLDLQLDLEGPPALVDRLIAEGFRAPAGGGDVEAA